MHVCVAKMREISPVIYTVVGLSMSGGKHIVQLISSTFVTCVVNYCALYGMPEMTKGLTVLMVLQSGMTMADLIVVKNKPLYALIPLIPISSSS